jgi:hypothetical protein
LRERGQHLLIVHMIDVAAYIHVHSCVQSCLRQARRQS